MTWTWHHLELWKSSLTQRNTKKWGQKDLQFVETARKFLPDIDGCTLSNETDWFTRFKVSYPCWFPPYSTSSVYFDSDNMSKRKAFIFCIAWAWSHHFRQSGTVCPYDMKVWLWSFIQMFWKNRTWNIEKWYNTIFVFMENCWYAITEVWERKLVLNSSHLVGCLSPATMGR